MFVNYNPNPLGKRVEDCSIRAISKAFDITWDEAYDLLASFGKVVADLQNSNVAIDILLRVCGFEREIIPNTCPFCYTANDFCYDNPHGTYVLGFGNHVATVVDGKIYDSWDSSSMVPIYYYRKDE